MSQPDWIVEHTRCVVTYLIGLREAGKDIRTAIHSLHFGIPEDAHKLQDHPETWEWVEASHWITFIVDQDRRWIYLTAVESTTVD